MVCSLIIQRSQAACTLGQTFGCSSSGQQVIEQRMWVSGGCRGTFKCHGVAVECRHWHGTVRSECTCIDEQETLRRGRAQLKAGAAAMQIAAVARAWRRAVTGARYAKQRYTVATIPALALSNFSDDELTALVSESVAMGRAPEAALREAIDVLTQLEGSRSPTLQALPCAAQHGCSTRKLDGLGYQPSLLSIASLEPSLQQLLRKAHIDAAFVGVTRAVRSTNTCINPATTKERERSLSATDVVLLDISMRVLWRVPLETPVEQRANAVGKMQLLDARLLAIGPQLLLTYHSLISHGRTASFRAILSITADLKVKVTLPVSVASVRNPALVYTSSTSDIGAVDKHGNALLELVHMAPRLLLVDARRPCHVTCTPRNNLCGCWNATPVFEPSASPASWPGLLSVFTAQSTPSGSPR